MFITIYDLPKLYLHLLSILSTFWLVFFFLTIHAFTGGFYPVCLYGFKACSIFGQSDTAGVLYFLHKNARCAHLFIYITLPLFFFLPLPTLWFLGLHVSTWSPRRQKDRSWKKQERKRATRAITAEETPTGDWRAGTRGRLHVLGRREKCDKQEGMWRIRMRNGAS